MTSDAALNALREAARVSPGNLPLRRHLADTLLAAGRPAEAEGEYQAALTLAPGDPGITTGLAEAFVWQGRYGPALVALEAVLAAPGHEPRASLIAARALAGEGDLESAAARYREAVSGDPALSDPQLASRIGAAGPPHPPQHTPPAAREGSMPPSGPEGPLAPPGPGGALPLEAFDRPANAGPTAEPERSPVGFADVAGMEAVKEAVRMKLLLPFQQPELFAAFGKRAGGGVLLYGPPGCGKTHLARATAGELGGAFINVGLADILDMYIGRSEQNLRATFELARRQRPCVLFFDEVDALAARRSDMHQAAGRRLVNQFLAELDGLNDRANDGVLVLTATNAPWYIDVAFRRPGRFDQMVFVPPPDAAARSAILSILCRDKPLADVDFSKVAKATAGYVGADLKGLVDRAVEAKLQESMHAGRPVPLSTADLLAAARTVRPTAAREWLATARNYVLHANESGVWDDLLPWLRDLR